MSVLDVGCGSGVITGGIAQAVGPTGTVVGVDVSEELLAQAAAKHSGEANLSFEIANVVRLSYRDAFDVVTAARVLQWLGDPMSALAGMVAAVKPGGRIVVLDYSHAKARWEPEPPVAFTRFYHAFLDWRADAGMDNAIADHLAAMLSNAGLLKVEVTDESELTTRSDAEFDRRMSLWPSVIATRGHQVVADGMLEEAERAAAGEAFMQWLATDAELQSMYLLAATGEKPQAT
jgi:SAM-dependent methyltransferase